jgi:hypothetical protein
MESKVLSSLDGVGIFGIISICLFFTFFTGMLLWAARLKKPYLNSMRDLPLDAGESAAPTRLDETSSLETRHE